MTKYLKIVACTAVAMAFASPASAKVINLYDLRNWLYPGSDCRLGKGCHDVDYYACNPQDGTFSAKPAGMDCDLNTFAGGVKCYSDCRCPASQFPYTSDCGGTYFVAPTADSAKCTDQTGTYYASCSCASGFYNRSIESDSTVRSYFDISQAYSSITTRAGNEFRCYNPSRFTCGGTMSTVQMPASEIETVRVVSGTRFAVSNSEPVEYEIAAFPNDDINAYRNGTYPACAKGSWLVKAPAMVSEPTETKCAAYTSALAKYAKAPRTYYYYTGTRQTGTTCELVSGDCVANATDHVTAYYPGTNTTEDVTITYTTGCRIGWSDDGGYFCAKGLSTDSVGIVHNVVNINGGQCFKVMGCDTASGYEQYSFKKYEGYILAENDDMIEAKTDDTKTYSVSRTTSRMGRTSEPLNDSDAYIVCRTPTGCKTTNSSGQPICDMNTAWGGWLKVFAQ